MNYKNLSAKNLLSLVKIENQLDNYRDVLVYPKNRSWMNNVQMVRKELADELIDDSVPINNLIIFFNEVIRGATEKATTIILDQQYKSVETKAFDAGDMFVFNRILDQELRASQISNAPRLWGILGVNYGQGMERGLGDLGLSPEEADWELFRETTAYRQRAVNNLKYIYSSLGHHIKGVVASQVAEGNHPYDIAKRLRELKLQPKLVNVAPKIVNGEVVRKGYSYTINQKRYSEMIARTEASRAINQGRLDAYHRGGIERVEWLSAGDNRVCILEGTAKVLTENGPKNIKDIRKGEKVLTHKDRYREVVKTWHRKTDENVVRVTLSGKLKTSSLTATENHPFYVLRNNKNIWVQAKDLKNTDKIYYFARKCPICGNKMPIGNKVCSLSCASKKGNKRRKENKEHYESVLKSNQEKGTRFDWGWKNKKRLLISMKAAHKKLGSNHLSTNIELKVEKHLKQQNIKYKRSQYFNFKNKRRWVDFYLPEYNLIIECDGEYWHSLEEVKQKDIQKDLIASEMGYQTLRLKGKEIRENFGNIKKQIHNAIYNGCFVPIKIKNLKKWKLKKNQPVYNLTVKDDNSYIVNYMVVHNCSECISLDGSRFLIIKAPTIPLHVDCRCTYIIASGSRIPKNKLKSDMANIGAGEALYRDSFNSAYINQGSDLGDILPKDSSEFKADYQALSTLQRKRLLRTVISDYKSIGMIPRVAHDNLDDVAMMVLQSKKIANFSSRYKSAVRASLLKNKEIPIFIGKKSLNKLSYNISARREVKKYLSQSLKKKDALGYSLINNTSKEAFFSFPSLSSVEQYMSLIETEKVISGLSIAHEGGHILYKNLQLNYKNNLLKWKRAYKLEKKRGTLPTLYSIKNDKEGFSETFGSILSRTRKVTNESKNLIENIIEDLL